MAQSNPSPIMPSGQLQPAAFLQTVQLLAGLTVGGIVETVTAVPKLTSFSDKQPWATNQIVLTWLRCTAGCGLCCARWRTSGRFCSTSTGRLGGAGSAARCRLAGTGWLGCGRGVRAAVRE